MATISRDSPRPQRIESLVIRVPGDPEAPAQSLSACCPIGRICHIDSGFEFQSYLRQLDAIKGHLRQDHPQWLACSEPLCPAVFLQPVALEAHTKATHLQIPCIVSTCSERFSSILYYNCHLIQQHRFEGLVCGGNNDTDAFRCRCGKLFHNPIALHEHKEIEIHALQQRLDEAQAKAKQERDRATNVVKWESIEAYTIEGAPLQPPRDSVEPRSQQHHGILRASDEVMFDPMRNTDEIIVETHQIALQKDGEMQQAMLSNNREREGSPFPKFDYLAPQSEATGRPRASTWHGARLEKAGILPPPYRMESVNEDHNNYSDTTHHHTTSTANASSPSLPGWFSDTPSLRSSEATFLNEFVR